MVKINYGIEGNGEVIVFIHGLSDSMVYWEPLVQGFKNDYKVLRFDLRGHGQSELGSDEISIDTYTDDLNGILDQLNIQKVNLVGFSLGGAVALNFAINYPSKVSSIVLMSSFAKLSAHSENVLNQFLNTLNIGFEEFYDYILPLVLCPDVIEDNREELDFLKNYSASIANVDAFKKAVVASLNFDVWDKLENIDVPVLFLAGKYDEIFTPDEQKELNEKISNSRLVVLDNVRHNLLVGKNIVAVLDNLKNFYKK
ncbi:alpha/beta fold hydrolase [Methanobrevibacter sp.]|uniref:alpha/beta fold hydrolase n=1 Tax=Methanobrevibacter sp. TaxID=66852 RepID=UPI00388FA083